ncbi:unnamed protein product [Aphanomyces euteiches]
MSTKAPKPTEKTFQYQDELPSLPLPSLEQTLEAYIKSAEPLLTPAELEHTKGVCHDFLHGIGPQLQAILEERAGSERNWLEEWWETFGYMKPRYPSAININWFGVVPGNWGPREMSQCEAAAIFTDALLQYRREYLAYVTIYGEQETTFLHVGKRFLRRKWAADLFACINMPVSSTLA